MFGGGIATYETLGVNAVRAANFTESPEEQAGHLARKLGEQDSGTSNQVTTCSKRSGKPGEAVYDMSRGHNGAHMIKFGGRVPLGERATG